ncbi:PREDICTED: uncharacterized protein LOC105556083 [Vollenhovia emeryi]|uniref:uncharacterized protein LOC105556083 n=1 Tax=Vollenhovia emeryi TaxID=411798 RepID=UPI0005F50986|nr:PREDICTED: uncharacterized protein LOC105556083 [Vollenhovia emeryi]
MSCKKELSVKDNSNKKRLPNFSTDEKITLIEIIDSKKHIIENKQTDSVTIKDKEKCWLDISREFNSRCIQANRNVASLKSCWDNLKKRTRKHFAEIRKEVFATGGGKMTIPDDPIAEKVKNVIEPSVDGLRNQFDSDYVAGVDDVNEGQDTNDDVFMDIEALDEAGLTSNWADWTPAMLHSKKSTELQVPVCDDKEVPNSDLTYAEVETILGTSSKDNRDATNVASSIVKKKILKRGRQTKTPVLSAVRRNQCFYDLAQSKTELVELMKEDLRAKSKIELKILNTQLQKEQLEIELLRKQLQSYEK